MRANIISTLWIHFKLTIWCAVYVFIHGLACNVAVNSNGIVYEIAYGPSVLINGIVKCKGLVLTPCHRCVNIQVRVFDGF